MEVAGISKDSPDTEGGIKERDEFGEPTGMLRETATYLVEEISPPTSKEFQRKALKYATQEMLSFGITSFMDPSVGKEISKSILVWPKKVKLNRK